MVRSSYQLFLLLLLVLRLIVGRFLVIGCLDVCVLFGHNVVGDMKVQ
jgi:hypothetical protein